MEKPRICPECGDPVYGRIDKKFCSDPCRNAYNNRHGGYTNSHIRKINNILKRNRKILEDLNPNGKAKVHRKKLETKGYNFEYHTNIYRTKSGNVYHFCYELGYLELDNDFFALVKRDSNPE